MKNLIISITLILAMTGSSHAQKPVENIASALSRFKVVGITWHAITLKQDKFDVFKKMLTDVMGQKPVVDQEGFAMFSFPDGSVLELYWPDKIPAYGYNGSIIFGFRVRNIEAASEALTKAGCEMLGETVHLQEQRYAYREFRGPDGLVYGLNEQK